MNCVMIESQRYSLGQRCSPMSTGEDTRRRRNNREVGEFEYETPFRTSFRLSLHRHDMTYSSVQYTQSADGFGGLGSEAKLPSGDRREEQACGRVTYSLRRICPPANRGRETDIAHGTAALSL